MYCRFALKPHRSDALRMQVSRGLERRTQLLSRKQLPGMWKVTDKLNPSGNVSAAAPGRSRLLGGINLLLGIVLLVPGILRWKEDAASARLMVTAGALGIGIGLLTLGNDRMQKSARRRFDRAADMLVANLAEMTPGQAQVWFDAEGMTIEEPGSRETVPYDRIECVIEESDLFLLTFDGRVLLLPKADLAEGTVEDLHSLLASCK